MKEVNPFLVFSDTRQGSRKITKDNPESFISISSQRGESPTTFSTIHVNHAPKKFLVRCSRPVTCYINRPSSSSFTPTSTLIFIYNTMDSCSFAHQSDACEAGSGPESYPLFNFYHPDYQPQCSTEDDQYASFIFSERECLGDSPYHHQTVSKLSSCRVYPRFSRDPQR